MACATGTFPYCRALVTCLQYGAFPVEKPQEGAVLCGLALHAGVRHPTSVVWTLLLC